MTAHNKAQSQSRLTPADPYSVDQSELDQYRRPAAGSSSVPRATRKDRCVRTVPECDVALDAVSPSPHQPAGRPSATAIKAIESALTELQPWVPMGAALRSLVDEAGASLFASLSHEAQALALLAADLSEHGQDEALDVHRVGDTLELLSGHRRLAAARIAGLTTVRVREHIVMTDEDAADWVARANLFRTDWQPWHRAKQVERMRARQTRGAASTSYRALGALVGCSHTQAATFLTIVGAFPQSLVAELGDGDEARGHELLSRMRMKELTTLCAIEDPQRRLDSTRATLGMAATTHTTAEAGDAAPNHAAVPPVRPAVAMRDRRGGGVVLEVRVAVADLSEPERRGLEVALESLLKQVRGADAIGVDRR